MIFRLWCNANDGHFTYRIAKNPASPPFVRDLSSTDDGSRRVTGRYEDAVFCIAVENDALALIDRLRNENKASYVSALPYAVNPRNLRAAAVALKSALDGKVPTGMDPAVFFSPSSFGAALGPFLSFKEDPIATYLKLGFVVNEHHPASQGFQHARFFSLLAANLSLTEFLQRVFVGAYALTARQGEERYFSDDQIGALIRRSEAWLGRCDNAAWVVRRLTNYRTAQGARFQAALAAHSEPDGDTEDCESLATEAPGEARVGLHTRRHQTILRLLGEGFPDLARTRIVDLGCGDGALTAALAERGADVLGIDADERVRRALRRAPSARLLRANLLEPYLEPQDLCPDVLILSEVIEHLGEADRRLLMRQVARMWRPTVVLLTTPNAAWNATIGLAPGAFRHPDHRIEYGAAELEKEVLSPLRTAGYAVSVVPIDGLAEEAVQPSFIVVARRVLASDDEAAKSTALGLVRTARDALAPLFLEEVSCAVGRDEMREGAADPVYRHHRDTAFYLSPTMAPVDHDPAHPEYLEHPEAAFHYYLGKGVRHLVGEHKYMGSRAHLLAFADEEAARRAGMPPLTVISRSGRPFFHGPALAALWERVRPLLRLREAKLDFLALDCEVLPWALKAAKEGEREGEDHGLIARAFRAPGEAALLRAHLVGDERLIERASRFLETLSWFDKPGPLVLRPFGLLACGVVSRRETYVGVQVGAAMTHLDQLARISELVEMGDLFLPVEAHLVDLMAEESRAASIRAWEAYTSSAGRGEGFVYKPLDARACSPSGTPIQPALKVRGRAYLELIYGIGYTDKEVFSRLVARGTRTKRKVALREHVLGQRLLWAFLSKNREAHARLVAAFLGMDAAAGRTLDATL